MHSRTKIAIVSLAVIIAAAIAWQARHAPPETSAPEAAVEPVRIERPRVAEPPPVINPARMRRLLSTRLGHPKILRIERVIRVRDPRYAGVACGHVAWGDTPDRIGPSRRFIATRRNVKIEGREDIDALWARICVPRTASGPAGLP